MKLYNTMTRQKEQFAPISTGKVTIYACGPTPYNKIHIGNARQLCVFDVLRRYFAYRGYNVFYVQNFTDIDDKIIRKAAEMGISPKDFSENMIKEYFVDAHGLNIRDADVHPKVTENIEIIINIITTLIDKGFAYEAGGDVFFQTAKFSEYGKLSHMPLDDLQAGARIDVDDKKRDPMDFALWKAAKEGEPFWEAPFGNGRPGWHIECSAMAGYYIGKTVDIHGGGSDLIFPHHENEIAQSECANGCSLANLWMHNGMLTVDKVKMSKSKNNFFLVRDLAGEYGYEAIRLMLLEAQYRSQLNYSTEVIESSVASLERLYNCKNLMTRLLSTAVNGSSDDVALSVIKLRKEQFIAAMDDDLNTADAISTIFELVRDINIALLNDSVTNGTITAYMTAFDELTDVLGILYQQEEKIPENVLSLIEKRKEARKNKDFALADEIRNEISKLGFILEETRQGTVIKRI